MQTLHPKIDRLQQQLKSRRYRKKRGPIGTQRDREKLLIAQWKHSATPGHARL